MTENDTALFFILSAKTPCYCLSC